MKIKRQAEHHPALAGFGAGAHQQGRGDLRGQVEHDQDDQHSAGRLRRDVRHEQELRRAGGHLIARRSIFAASPSCVTIPCARKRRTADVLLEVGAQHVEERDEHGELQHERQAGGERVDPCSPGRASSSPLLALFVVLVLLFQHLHLRSEQLHLAHRAELAERQRHHHRAHHHRQADDRKAPAEPAWSWMNTRTASKRLISGENASWMMFARIGMCMVRALRARRRLVSRVSGAAWAGGPALKTR